MTNPKTDHKTRKPPTTHPPRPAPAPAAAPEKQTSASATVIEACDRLGQKLDEVGDILRQQIEAWRQIRPPTAAGRENAIHGAVESPRPERASSTEDRPPGKQPDARAESQPQPNEAPPSVPRNHKPPPAPTPQPPPEREQPQDDIAPWPPAGNAPAPLPGAPANNGLVAMAAGANSLVDTLSQSGNGWPEQAAGVQQALENIMAYLENQAATAPPKLDVDGLMNRLRNLEEQQQTLQSQFNNSR